MSGKFIIHRRDKFNAGDMASNPKNYFEWLGDWKVIDITGIQWFNLNDCHVILGGGGLLYDDFEPFMMKILGSKLRSLTLWGIGRNRHGRDDTDLPRFGQMLLDKADLVGLRDCMIHDDWIPCPSVMHHLFDEPMEKNGKLAVQHREDRFRWIPPQNFMEVKMQGNIDALIEEIASAEVVMSSSYHGALWGLCAGAKTCSVNGFSQKFKHGLPHTVHHVASDNGKNGWMKKSYFDILPENKTWLAEARKRSIEFNTQVQELVSRTDFCVYDHPLNK